LWTLSGRWRELLAIVRTFLRIFVALSALYLAIVVGFFVMQRALLFPAPRNANAVPPSGFSAVQPRQRRWPEAHGSLSAQLKRPHAIGAGGYGLLLVEYRGYARNPGSPAKKDCIVTGAPPWLG
jgi:uncharacterized protein